MDIFYKVKNEITPKELMYSLYGEPKKNEGRTWFYYSPLRAKERTASLAVNDEKGFTDFGTGKHYDIISFVAELNGCSQKEACIRIANIFGVNIGYSQSYKSKIFRQKIQEQVETQEKVNKWFDETYIKMANIYKKWHNLEHSCFTKPTMLPMIYKNRDYFEWVTDVFINATSEDKINLYRERERFDRYEREGTI